jgi:hypothetical protein
MDTFSIIRIEPEYHAHLLERGRQPLPNVGVVMGQRTEPERQSEYWVYFPHNSRRCLHSDTFFPVNFVPGSIFTAQAPQPMLHVGESPSLTTPEMLSKIDFMIQALPETMPYATPNLVFQVGDRVKLRQGLPSATCPFFPPALLASTDVGFIECVQSPFPGCPAPMLLVAVRFPRGLRDAAGNILEPINRPYLLPPLSRLAPPGATPYAFPTIHPDGSATWRFTAFELELVQRRSVQTTAKLLGGLVLMRELSGNVAMGDPETPEFPCPHMKPRFRLTLPGLVVWQFLHPRAISNFCSISPGQPLPPVLASDIGLTVHFVHAPFQRLLSTHVIPADPLDAVQGLPAIFIRPVPGRAKVGSFVRVIPDDEEGLAIPIDPSDSRPVTSQHLGIVSAIKGWGKDATLTVDFPHHMGFQVKRRDTCRCALHITRDPPRVGQQAMLHPALPFSQYFGHRGPRIPAPIGQAKTITCVAAIETTLDGKQLHKIGFAVDMMSTVTLHDQSSAFYELVAPCLDNQHMI